MGAFPLVLLLSDPNLQYLIAIGGGLIGGVAAGFLWTAQGAYFATSAKLYAEAHEDGSVTAQQATASLASLFGAIFLGFELLLKIAPLASVIADEGSSYNANATASSPPPALPPYPPRMAPPIPLFSPNDDGGTQPKGSDVIIAIVYSICAIMSSIAMASIWDLEKRQVASSINGDATDHTSDPPAAVPPRPKLSLAKIMSAVLLWCKEPAVMLLAPVQVTFGLCAALLGNLVAHQVVPKTFPDRVATAAGCLSALVALIAALLQYPFSKTAAHVGKPPLMISGLLAFGGLAVLCLLLDIEQLAATGTLVSCYALQGVGRACYEGTNKALYADFFPNDTEAAFSNIVLANGIASAVGFFLFPSLANGTMASIALVSAGIAMIGYLGAEVLRKCKPTSFEQPESL